VDSSKRQQRRVALLAVAAVMAILPLSNARAAPSSKKVVLTGTVTAISQVDAKRPSRRNWAVTVQVETVRAGEYAQPVFTFTVHSPARTGLAVGRRYTIEAVWTGVEYVVDETRPIKADMLSLRVSRLPNPALQADDQLGRSAPSLARR
jgi:hypothetical protein